ncbi:hypothetical protein GQ600_20139 [Phytophthora cactorum]|nr:hypothetical protein GQ600_20139 [Phytophthora cactorum]
MVKWRPSYGEAPRVGPRDFWQSYIRHITTLLGGGVNEPSLQASRDMSRRYTHHENDISQNATIAGARPPLFRLDAALRWPSGLKAAACLVQPPVGAVRIQYCSVGHTCTYMYTQLDANEAGQSMTGNKNDVEAGRMQSDRSGVEPSASSPSASPAESIRPRQVATNEKSCHA